MSFAALLPHTCTIETRTAGTRDGQGRLTETVTLTTGVKCRLAALGGNSKDAAELELQARAVVATHKLYLLYGTAITSSDRVLTIADADGITLITAAEVEFVKRPTAETHIHHLEVLIKEVA